MEFLQVCKEVYPLLLKGMGVTVKITLLSLAIAFVLGLLLCIMGISHIKPLLWVNRFYLWIIRGTPILVQALIIYFGIPQLIGQLGGDLRLTPFIAGTITLSLNAGAYISEIFRGGIQAVPPGQMEAARSLGLSKGRAMYRVVLPQAIRICFPSLINQFIISLKDTSIISVISLAEITYQAKIYVGRTMQSFYTYVLVGVVYLIVITILTYLSKWAERRLNS